MPYLIQSFDKTTTTIGSLVEPERYRDLWNLPLHKPIIARGAGLSYCAASAGNQCVSVDMRNFNRILSFDEINGIITVEAGIPAGELNNFLIGKNWVLPVLPGYPAITIGGCIGFNVHGKSQYKVGTFINWVKSITLFHPDTGLQTCTPDTELFQLTVGGMGLTGIIISATIALKKIDGNLMSIQAMKVPEIQTAVEVMATKAEEYDYIYAWNNFNLRGKHFGKGIVYLENHLPDRKELNPKPYINKLNRFKKIPVLYNGLTVRTMNRVYELMDALQPRQRVIDLVQASFPIYNKELYYYFFGKKGFREYQVIFDLDKWQAAVAEIQKIIAQMNMPIALGSLKIFKGEPHNISFSGSGLCVTIDVPNNKKSISFFEALDKITLKYGGIINLSKDSRAYANLVKHCFPHYEQFKQGIHRHDPNQYFGSEIRTRLDL
jgi:decaprenylphospho-beta-D-ribofuranose 2-oxidase